MELSKFRRKVKTPAIATDAKSLTPEAESPPTTLPQPPSATSLKTQKQGLRKGAFRGLHLRSAVKRARSPAPSVPTPPAQSSPPTGSTSKDVNTDYLDMPVPMSPVSVRHRDGQVAEEEGNSKSKLPAFLNQTNEALENKFMDVQWNERTRQNGPVARAAAADPDTDYPYILHQDNLDMNRYGNILPYNHTRVRLHVPEETVDYVNASTITVPSVENKLPPLRYIAMQGPIEASVDHVWRMVAEQFERTAVIVQLTTMFENNSPKCFPYLPLSEDEEPRRLNEADHWGDGWAAELRLDSVELLEEGAIELRKLILRIDPPRSEAQDDSVDGDDGVMDVTTTSDTAPEQDSREIIVWHMLYTKWPDFGPPAPNDIPSFLALMKLSREYCLRGQDVDTAQVAQAAASENTTMAGEAEQKEMPLRIVHCSAGVGRTGTFITLEHLMRELDAGTLEDYDGNVDGSLSSKRAIAQHDSRDLVLQTVETLREQRTTMVQAPKQFTFLYGTLRQMWLDRYGANSENGDAEEPAAKRLEIGDPFVD